MTQPDILNALKEKPYLQVPFPMKRSVLENAISSFMRFLQEPDEIKKHIDFKISLHHRRGDVGFKHRDPDDGMYNDSKDFFHYHPAIFDRYPEFVNSHPVVRDFLDKAQPIWELAALTVRNLLSQLEPTFPGTVDRIFNTTEPHFQLRFLNYNWQESGKNLAKPHFDAGSFTLAIAESCPGLRIGTNPNDMELIEHKEEKAIFMVSSNFQKTIDTDELRPGWHDVIQLDETIIGKPFARWAIVAFVDAHGVEALSRAETHKWYVPQVA